MKKSVVVAQPNLKQYVHDELISMKQMICTSTELDRNPVLVENISIRSADSSLTNGEVTTSIIESDGSSKKQYPWEEHSSGMARNTIVRMGYKGKGLGKNENGIVEAITVDNIRPRKKKTAIFSSSITRGISTNGFNKILKGSIAKFHKFNGKKPHHIKGYIQTHLEEDQPDYVAIVAGGNDVPIGKFESVSTSTIADDNWCVKIMVLKRFLF